MLQNTHTNHPNRENTTPERRDLALETQAIATLVSAGYRPTLAEIQERTGYNVEEIQEHAQTLAHPSLPLRNRAAAEPPPSPQKNSPPSKPWENPTRNASANAPNKQKPTSRTPSNPSSPKKRKKPPPKQRKRGKKPNKKK